MNKIMIFLFLVSSAASAACWNGKNPLVTPRFLAWVKSHTSPHRVLLLGDSIMVGITRAGIQKSTLHAGMGANQIQDMTRILEQVRLPDAELKSIVIGSTGINNEMNCSTGASVPAFDALLSLIRSKYPLARVVSIGIPPNAGGRFSPVLKHRDEINRHVRERVDCYVDTDALFGAQGGIAHPAFFLDGVHFTLKTAQMVKEAIRIQCDVEI